MAEFKEEKLIRDSLGSPIPQYFNVDLQTFAAKTTDGRVATVDFSKTKLLRDKLGSPIPQLWDVTSGKWIEDTGQGGGNGEAVTMDKVIGLPAKLANVETQLAQTVTGVNGVKPVNGNVTIPVPVIDTSTLATKPEVQSAMDRADKAFTRANDGKTLVAVAVTAKGVSASPSDTFSQLAGKIGQIAAGGSGVPMGTTYIQLVSFPPLLLVTDTLTQKLEVKS